MERTKKMLKEKNEKIKELERYIENLENTVKTTYDNLEECRETVKILKENFYCVPKNSRSEEISLKDEVYEEVEDVLYRYYMTEYALEKHNYKKVTLKELHNTLGKWGLRVDLRQPDNGGKIEISNLGRTRFYTIEI